MRDTRLTKRHGIGFGMAAGMVWSFLLLWVGATYVTLPVITLVPTIMTAFLAPGLVLIAMIGRQAQRRFFDDTIIDGGPLAGSAEIDGRVLQNTLEQLVLAMAVWPAAAVLLGEDGPGVILTLGIWFAVARLLFWAGYHVAPPLRAIGFATTFYPTVLVALWALMRLAGLGV